MAASMSKVCISINKNKLLCKLCLDGRYSFSLMKRYRQNFIHHASCYNYSKSIPQDEKENAGCSRNDLDHDFLGIEQLKDPTYQTESIDSHKVKRFENVDASKITEKGMDRMKLESNIQAFVLPYGNVRFDRKVGKGYTDVDTRLTNKHEEQVEVLKRKIEKQRKKLHRYENKGQTEYEVPNQRENSMYGEEKFVKNSDEYVSYAEDIGNIFEGQMNQMPIGESKVLQSIDHNTTHAADTDLSYMDQVYFGNSDTTSSKDTRSNEVAIELGFIDGQYFHTSENSDNGRLEQKGVHKIDPLDIDIKRADMFPKSSFENLKTEETLSEQSTQLKSDVQEQFISVTVARSETMKESKKLKDKMPLQESVNNQLPPDLCNEMEFSNNPTNILNKKEKKDKKKMDAISTDQMSIEANNDVFDSSDVYEEPSDLEKMQSFEDLRTYSELGNRRARYSKRKMLVDKEMSSAYNVSKQIRNEYAMKENINLHGRANPKEFDTKGFRILTKQTPDFDNVPSLDIIKILRQNILFNNKDVVAISKPYGLPLQGGVDTNLSIDRYLKSIIPLTTLHSIDTMETDVTGVMLFGKTVEMKELLLKKMEQGEVCKKYLTITKNIPTSTQGEIDIPIVEAIVNGKHRMALRPHRTAELSSVLAKRQPGRDAISRYRVLSHKDNSYALLECIPLTNVKHQLRVHLGLGLNCPILGDHKYSHMNKYAPMNLHPIMLERLKIQQSKVRHLALHLHCRSIMIPNFLDGRNLFVTAPFSVHFLANMRDLKLKLPPHV